MQGTSAKHKRKVAPSLHPPFHTSVINNSPIPETRVALKIEMLREKQTDRAVHSRFGLRQRTSCLFFSEIPLHPNTHLSEHCALDRQLQHTITPTGALL